MKKSLLAAALCMLLSVFAANATMIYFQNSAGWKNVYAKEGNPPYQLIEKVKDGDIENAPANLWCYDASTATVQFANLPDADSGFLVTGKLAVGEGGNVYDANSRLIGTITGNKYTAIPEGEITTVNTGYYLVGTMTGENLLSSYQFSETGGTYTLKATLIAGAEFRIEKNGVKYGVAASSDNMINDDIAKQFNFNLQVDGEDLTVDYNYVLEFSFTEEKEGESVVGLNLVVNVIEYATVKWYGVWKSGNTWVLAGEFNPEDGGAFSAKFDAGPYSELALYQTVGDQTWQEGIRWMPKPDEYDNPDNIQNTYSGSIETGSSGTWVLNNGYDFGTWSIRLSQYGKSISFERNVSVIVIGGKPYDMSSQSAKTWTGAIEEGDSFEYYNGNYITIESLDNGEPSDGNMIYTGELKYEYNLSGEGDAYTFPFSSDNATIDIDGWDVTITAFGAVKPVIVVGEKNIELTGSGKIFSVEGVELNKNPFAFDIAGKRYVPVIQGTISYEAFSATFTLEESEDNTATATFEDVKTALKNGETVDFISANGNFTPDVTVNLSTNKVTFSWDKATGVDAIEADNCGEAVYFNLQGVRVDNPESGLFIEVKGGKATKVLK